MEVATTDNDKEARVKKNFPPPEPEYTAGTLFMKHLFALEVKRFHHAKRNKKGFFCEVQISITHTTTIIRS